MTTPRTTAGRQTSLDRLRTEAAAPYAAQRDAEHFRAHEYRDALAALVAAGTKVLDTGGKDGWIAFEEALAAARRALDEVEP